MSDQAKRRAVLRAIASTHLPLPLSVEIYEVGQGFSSDHVGLRVDDNQPGYVDAWAEVFGGDTPTYGGVVEATKTAKAFRSYATRVVLAGWDTGVCSYVDLDVVPAVES